jgi:hypothetical protein
MRVRDPVRERMSTEGPVRHLVRRSDHENAEQASVVVPRFNRGINGKRSSKVSCSCTSEDIDPAWPRVASDHENAGSSKLARASF